MRLLADWGGRDDTRRIQKESYRVVGRFCVVLELLLVQLILSNTASVDREEKHIFIPEVSEGSKLVSMHAVTSLPASVAYLDRWSWRTWVLLQSYVERCNSLEVQMADLQKEVRSLKRRVEAAEWSDAVENVAPKRKKV